MTKIFQTDLALTNNRFIYNLVLIVSLSIFSMNSAFALTCDEEYAFAHDTLILRYDLGANRSRVHTITNDDSNFTANEKRDGTYICAACNQPLFESSTKFESGTGWPSFYDHIPGALATRKDYKLIWPRTEYHCSRCGGHQGHVFKDGPEPTHLRYCNNGEALHFVPKGEKLPELRQ